MRSTIYIRTLKKADHTVFCVDDSQKKYWDELFNTYVPYSSGQQIKRCVLEALCDSINEQRSPVTFISSVEMNKKTEKLVFAGEGEAYGTCNPIYSDQLFGGWMKAIKGDEDKILKRRSPLSISAMRSIHPKLSILKSENVTFDRKNASNNEIIIKQKTGKEEVILSKEDALAFINNNDNKASLTSKYIMDEKRTSGYFVQDIAIDLRRLFSVSMDRLDPEISQTTEIGLIEDGWIESTNAFGKCLVAPKELRDKLIKALAYAIINWKITSNQARTFSLMETLAITISDNANKISASIRADIDESRDSGLKLVVEQEMKAVDAFVFATANGYIEHANGDINALDAAEQKLIDIMNSFDYENQL